MLPPNYSEPQNICTTCGKQWEGNPYEYETDNHEFPCPECAAQQSVQRTGGESGQQSLFSAGEVLPAKVTRQSTRR